MFNHFFSGICIGIANLIPGVSGGTIAVIFGIYDDIITAINTIISTPLQSISAIKKITILGLGALTGIYAFSFVIVRLMASYEASTLMFFMGLILGSIPVIYRQQPNLKLTPVAALLLCLGVGLVAGLCFLQPVKLTITPLILILSGGIATCTMVIPGISGSMVLLILGTYESIVGAVSTGDLAALFWIAVGAIFGGIIAIKSIHFLLHRFMNNGYHLIIGLMIGSVFQLAYPLTLSTTLSSLMGIVTIAFISNYLNQPR